MSFFSEPLKATLKLRALGIAKIPMLFFISPKVIELDAETCRIVVPLGYRTKNHLGGMYFGALAAGADAAGGLLAWQAIEAVDPKVKLIFKDFKAEFLKRAEKDVEFVNREGAAVRALVKKAADTGERVEMPVNVEAYCGKELVARMVLTLSLKKKAESP